MTLKCSRNTDGYTHCYSVMNQVADAVTEARNEERQRAHDTWAYLYDRALHTTGVEHADYQRAADEVALMQMWGSK